MKIAITDACIFIELFELELIDPFFQLELDINTSLEVFNELDGSQIAKLQPLINQNKLTVHTLTGEQLIALQAAGYSKGLSNSDKSALYLAEILEAVLLSSDKPVRNAAKNKGIEVHGMLWILEKLKEEGIISVYVAIQKLEELMEYAYYKNNPQLLAEIETRLIKLKNL